MPRKGATSFMYARIEGARLGFDNGRRDDFVRRSVSWGQEVTMAA
jgi:hypothetical protein